MDVDPQYKDIVHTDATALLRPKTGLKDMFIELNPGTKSAPVAKAGYTIPVKNTLPDINADEVYSALDADTRDYLRLLISGAGEGLHKRGGDLQEVFRRFEPTHKDLALVNKYVALRHRNLRRLIHQLNVLNGALAQKGDDLAELVDDVVGVVPRVRLQDQNITRAVGDLPGTLQQTTQTFGKVKTLADVLGPAVTKLRPTVSGAGLGQQGGHAVRQGGGADPAQRDPPVHPRRAPGRARPQAGVEEPEDRDARPDAHVHGPQPPVQHGRLQPERQGGPGQRQRDEGFLFWIAWLDHDGDLAVLELRRQRAVPPGDARRAVHDAEADRSSQPAARDDPRAPALRRPARLAAVADAEVRSDSFPSCSSMVVFALTCFGLLLFLWL